MFAVPGHEAKNVVARRTIQGDHAMAHIRRVCSKRRVVVQAGGNWGYWPLSLSYLFDAVYTFEPDAKCFACLAYNTRERGNVVRLQAALGNARALVDLRRDNDTTGNQSVSGRGIYPTLRIDDLGLDVCDLIYLDIEGCEADALLGAEETIVRCRPVVIFEARKAFQDQADTAEQWMRGMRYQQTGNIGADMVMQPC